MAIAVAAPYLAPIALGFLGITATATAIAIATAVVTIGLSLAATLAFRALGVGAPTARNAAGPPVVFRQSIANSFIVYGKRRVGGLLVFFHARQSGDDHFRYFVIAVAGHRCQGVVSFMLNDETVTVDGSNMVTSGKYASNAWLWFQRGLANETANATFVSECGGDWTTDHKGNGTAAIYAKFKLTDAVVEAGMPNITAIIEGRDEILDPRTATTGYSRNATLVTYDWLQIPREEGGFGAYDDEIPDDSWINAQANVCDETVNGAPRYALDGVIQTGADPGEIRDVLVVNQAGTYAYSAGKHLIRPGYWVPPTETLSEDDLAGPIQVSPFSTADAAANEVNGTYISPEANYQAAALTTQSADADDIRQIDVDLGFTTGKDQGDRILSIMLRRAQAEKTLVWPMNIAGLKHQAMDTVQVAKSEYGLDNYAWTITNWQFSADFGAVLNLREENSEIYDEPTPVAAVTPPPVTTPDPLETQAQTMSLIQSSSITGLTFSIADTGAVTVSDHTRVYPDKSVAVTGTGGGSVATGGVSGDRVYIFYDQADRSGGAVTYQYLVLAGAVGDDSDAYASPTHPYRHFVCSGLVPPAAGTTTGGSNPGSGSTGGGTYCVTTDTLILMAGGKWKPAGDIAVGDRVRTRHEETMEWGEFEVSGASIEPGQEVFSVPVGKLTLRATADHRVMVDGRWITMAEIGEPDGVADVVKLTVEDAHTYISNGLLSHNIKAGGPGGVL